jgi:tripartite-type tricarboxylate transporter receptor subunit TctC
MAGVIPIIKSGRLKVLGVATSRRIAFEPNWPTLSEQGVANFDYTVWSGLFVQKGVPAAIVRKLGTDVRAVLAEPDVAKKFAAFGAVPASEDLNAFVERIKQDTHTNEAIVRRANLSTKQ